LHDVRPGPGGEGLRRQGPWRGKLANVHIDAGKGAVIKYAHMTARDVTVRAAQGDAWLVGPDVTGLDTESGK
jgi:hypothetical protein